jgi:hypothetical protein
LRPHLSSYWKIPPDSNAAFVACMEDVLAVYQMSYDHCFPVVCMDESSKQLIGETREAIPHARGRGEIVDYEYVRNGVAEIFLELEPLTGRRHVEVTQRRTARDWAEFVRSMLEERYPDALKVILVADNLNTHTIASLYAAFPAEEARRLAERLEIHFTPKHGSWLNIAEIEFSAMSGQCLNRRIPEMEELKSEIAAWQNDRNNRGAPVDWRFTNENARIKLSRLYPNF